MKSHELVIQRVAYFIINSYCNSASLMPLTFVGAVGPCAAIYESLEIKHIQHDSLR